MVSPYTTKKVGHGCMKVGQILKDVYIYIYIYTFDNGRVDALLLVSKINKFFVSFELDQRGA